MLHINSGKHPDVPPFPFEEVRDKFRFLSLNTSVEAIHVMEYVRVECQHICEMNLFHVASSKPLKLEEFDLTQQQATTQVKGHSHPTCAHWCMSDYQLFLQCHLEFIFRKLYCPLRVRRYN